MLLAEAGADVVKVESPAGDPTRARAAFATWNRSKRSVVCDLETETGRTDLDRLLAGTDAVVHDRTPSRAKALGLDDRTLTHRFPALVVCSILGYPVTHPDVERPGHDLLVQARSGLMDENCAYRDGPVVFRFPLPSWAAAYLGAAGVVARLLVRENTGRGGTVHTSLLQGMLQTASLMWNRAENPTGTLISTKYDIPPQTAMYECSDGIWLQIMNPGERVDIIGLPFTMEVVAELESEGAQEGSEEQWSRAESDLRSGVRDAALLRRAMRRRPSVEWLKAFRAADVAVEPALGLGEMLTMPEVRDNGYVVEVEDPEWGRTLQAGTPFRADPPQRVRRPAPRLGEHTEDVLSEERAPAPVTRVGETPPHPLSGLKVLDLGSFLAGPMAPMLLGDLGADVIKVEPVTGDRLRYRAAFWEACSRSKRGIALDIHSEGGREVLDRLVTWADIVHHNQRPAAAAKSGIDEAGLRARNPEVVFGYVSAYGDHGARVGWPGFDSVFEALAGWEYENGGEGNPPQFSRLGCLDVQTALASTLATLLAQFGKVRSGVGGTVSGSLLGTSTMSQSETLLRLPDGVVAPYARLTHDQTGTGPGERIYRLSDGWVAVVAGGPDELRALREVAGAAADEEIEERLTGRSVEETLAALDGAGVAAELVREGYAYEFFDDPEARAAGLVADYPHAAFGRMEQPGAFWHFGDMELRLDKAAPVIGEDTRQILSQLGYSVEEIEKLYADGVVAGPVVPPAWRA
jgi:crotonobetainyl-CoA:carnitine CoA-transferase CaiB-like acyl-CoA transferase